MLKDLESTVLAILDDNKSFKAHLLNVWKNYMS